MAEVLIPLSLSNGLVRSLAFIYFLVSAVSASFLHASANSVCSELSTLLPNKVWLPKTTFYSSSTQSYFFRESRLNPNCVIVPSSTDDVSRTIKVLTANPSVKFAIKGGGHSVNKGASNIDDGITIDLSGMKAIEPQGGSWDTVEVGPGATSVDAYRVLDVHNRTIVGGRVASVGLAGFMTGGKCTSASFCDYIGFVLY
jgi:FAD/FMN-containing dehydrogenase